MADTGLGGDDQHAVDVGRHYLIRFEEDTLRSRPLWIRVIVEFLGTYLLVTVAAGAGVINHYAGGGPISRTTAVIAPGALVMALIYAWGPLSGLHINPAVTLAFTARRVPHRLGTALLGGAVRRGHPGRTVPPGRLRQRERGRELPHPQARR